MSEDLMAFLRARLAEDEAAARAATAGPWWHNPGKQWLGPEAFEKYDLRKGEEFVGYGGPHPFTGAVASTGPASNAQGMADATHIARHDPARVLAEVESKRAIVERYAWLCEHGDTGGTAWVLPLLAAVYASHPDYREEWRR